MTEPTFSDYRYDDLSFLPLTEAMTDAYLAGHWAPDHVRETEHGLEAAMLCSWFGGCDHWADGYVTHPILGPVPVCQRCVDNLDMEFDQA